MNDLLIKVLITVMVIDAGMYFYNDYKKNTYQSIKFLILTVLMAVSVGAALTKQEIDNVWKKMTIIEQKIEMQEEEKKPEELDKRSDKKWDSKIVRVLNAITKASRMQKKVHRVCCMETKYAGDKRKEERR